MAIAKMKLINITADNEYLNDVLLRFVDLDNFHPEPASKFVDRVHGLTMLSEENPIAEVLSRFQEIVNEIEIEPKEKLVEKKSYDLDEIKSYMEDIYQKFRNAIIVRNELQKVIQENKDALIQMKNIESSELNLDDLYECRYLKLRFGRLPLDSVKKLQFYRNRPFIFQSLNEDDTYSWCVYFTTKKYEGDVDNIFSSLYFERIYIPNFVHGTPEKARENLQVEIDDDLKQLAHVNDVIESLKKECSDQLCEMYSELVFLNHTYEARKYVVGLGERFSITGFAAEDDVNDLKAVFADLKEVEIEVRPAHSDRRLSPPTKLKNGWFARPFSMFVEMYGTPEYEGIDPTPFVAFTYSMLFGIMFGDLGQGITLCIVGYIAYKWKHMQLGAIGVRIGIVSALFGIVYGSFFGNETFLNPLYYAALGLKEKPIDVMTSEFIPILLVMAVGLGAVLIVCSIGINVYLQIKNKNYGEMVLSQNGIAGLVFYMSLLIGGVLQIVKGVKILTNPIFAIIFLLVPLALIFMKEPLERKMAKKDMFPDGVGSFCIESFFELFEICLSFITNTISYLRVGGFVLSHAGMMMAVMLIADMLGNGSLIAVVLGNIFVMCLEGMIVGIQVLRLEFYEMFSRYFTGNGIIFRTLKD